MSIDTNYVIGALCIAAGIVAIIVALGDLLLRVVVGIAAFSIINYGLKLRGLPPLQVYIPLVLRKMRWF